MTLPTLATRRLTLRPFAISDAETVQRLAGAPEIAATTMNIPHPYLDGIAEAWIAMHAQAFEDRRMMSLAVTTAEDGLVGGVGLTLAMEHLRGELGYWTAFPFWNRGYVTEAAAAVIEYGFEALGLNRIQARHMVRNPASGRVMQKLGMSPEGTMRQDMIVRGKLEDHVMYAILRSDRT